MPTEIYTIRRLPGWGADIEVKIECESGWPKDVKAGLAVRVAHITGADLTGARLTGAKLARAKLADTKLAWADLAGARLAGARLAGAKIHDDEITKLLASAQRSDGYTFTAFGLKAGGAKIIAGCRWFTIPEYRAHVEAEYLGTDKAIETLQILDFIEDRAKTQGVAVETKEGNT